MEELRMIVEMVSKLPQLALWVLIGLFAYKITVVGSIYGVIRFAIDKLHSWLTKPKHELKQVEVRPLLDGVVITGQVDALVAQLHRVRLHVNTGRGLQYLHSDGVDWLRTAIDEKIARDGSRP